MRVEDFANASAKASPDKIALMTGGRRLTFDDLGHESGVLRPSSQGVATENCWGPSNE
jgi:hypothetical protein